MYRKQRCAGSSEHDVRRSYDQRYSGGACQKRQAHGLEKIQGPDRSGHGDPTVLARSPLLRLLSKVTHRRCEGKRSGKDSEGGDRGPRLPSPWRLQYHGIRSWKDTPQVQSSRAVCLPSALVDYILDLAVFRSSCSRRHDTGFPCSSVNKWMPSGSPWPCATGERTGQRTQRREEQQDPIYQLPGIISWRVDRRWALIRSVNDAASEPASLQECLSSSPACSPPQEGGKQDDAILL